MDIDTYAYDDYIASRFAPQDAALSGALAEMEREGLRSMNVSASQGQLLNVLALAIGARRVLEIGTLGGYSGIHLARALPEGGRLITLELDPHHAGVARRNFERAGVTSQVEVRVGPAAETLRAMARGGEELFDIIFIDADKEGYPDYLALTLPMLRVGGLLLADNMLRGVLETEDGAAKRYNALVAGRSDLTSIVIPVLRRRGIDGLTVSIKTAVDAASPHQSR